LFFFALVLGFLGFDRSICRKFKKKCKEDQWGESREGAIDIEAKMLEK
jgi:hypothetical protein